MAPNNKLAWQTREGGSHRRDQNGRKVVTFPWYNDMSVMQLW